MSLFTALANYLPQHSLQFICGFRHMLAAGSSCRMHHHSAVEMVYHPTGRGETGLADGRRLRFGEGAVVFYPPGVRHDQMLVAPGSDLCIHFDFRGSRPEGLEAAVLVERVEDRALRNELQQLAQAQPRNSDLDRAALDHRISALLIGLVIAGGAPSRGDPGHAERAHAHIARDYQRLGRFEEIAETLGIGVDHLRHCFKERYGIGMARWLTEVRIERAKDLLMRSIMPLADIAEHCGFANAAYFCNVFREATGVSPARFRRAHADADPTEHTLARAIQSKPDRVRRM